MFRKYRAGLTPHHIIPGPAYTFQVFKMFFYGMVNFDILKASNSEYRMSTLENFFTKLIADVYLSLP